MQSSPIAKGSKATFLKGNKMKTLIPLQKKSKYQGERKKIQQQREKI
jgi:hypothetical protein